MIIHNYVCQIHGVLEFHCEDGERPVYCPMACGWPLEWVPPKFKIGGEIAWLKGREYDAIETQLGVRPESPEHLRAIEKKLGVVRTSKSEIHRTPDGPSDTDAEMRLRSDIRKAFAKGMEDARK